MGLRKWLMKQQWRIAQIRGIWSVFYGTLMLGWAYYAYAPFIQDLGIYGPFAFAASLLFMFLIMGYIYDRVLVMWAPSQEVAQERNPFQYVPSPKDHIFWFPIYSTLLDVTEQLADGFNVDTSRIEEAKSYYSKLQKLRAERKEDLDVALELRKKFVAKHAFSDVFDKAES